MGRHGLLTLSAVAAGAVAATIAATARGTVLPEVPFADGARRASAVVAARAIGSTTGWGATPAGRTRIYTTFRFEVESVLAGAATSRTLAVPVIGGEMDGRRLVVPGTPEFRPGDRCVLLLDPADAFTGLVGWTQGVFRIVRDPAGADRVLFHDGAAVAGFRDGKALRGTRPIPLAEFAAEVVRARAESPGAGGDRR